MKVLKYISVMVLLWSTFFTKGISQNQINLSQYMLYQPFLNPSAIGSYNALSAGVIHRNQWAGFTGAPVTNMLSVNSPIGKTNLALGLGFQKEKIGVSNATSIYSNIGYRFKLDKDSYISTGISLGVEMFNLSYGKLINSDNDLELSYGMATNNLMNPLARFGVFYYKRNFYLTAYVPNIITPRLISDVGTISVNSTFSVDDLHYYLQSGYRFKLSDKVETNLSTLLKKSSTFQYDLNFQFIFNDFIGVGASYRSSKEVVALINIKLIDKLKIGYAYDYSLSDLATVSNGSHEIMLILDFNKKMLKADIQIPRF